MDPQQRALLVTALALIARTRREVVRLRIEIQAALNAIEHSRRLLARTAGNAESTECVRDNA